MDGCLEVRARSGGRGTDAVEGAAERAGHVDPGPFGLGRRAAHPAAEPGGPAQFAELKTTAVRQSGALITGLEQPDISIAV